MNKVGAQATTLPPEVREIIEDAISRLIAFLDRVDAPLEDMEEDDHAGGNIEDEGEPSLGWTNRHGVVGFSASQEHLDVGHNDDLEDEYDGREPEDYYGPSWSEPVFLGDDPGTVRCRDGLAAMSDGSIWQYQPLPRP